MPTVTNSYGSGRNPGSGFRYMEACCKSSVTSKRSRISPPRIPANAASAKLPEGEGIITRRGKSRKIISPGALSPQTSAGIHAIKDSGGVPLDWIPSTQFLGFHDNGNVRQAEFEIAVMFVPESRSISKVDGPIMTGTKYRFRTLLSLRATRDALWPTSA